MDLLLIRCSNNDDPETVDYLTNKRMKLYKGKNMPMSKFTSEELLEQAINYIYNLENR